MPTRLLMKSDKEDGNGDDDDDNVPSGTITTL